MQRIDMMVTIATFPPNDIPYVLPQLGSVLPSSKGRQDPFQEA